MKEPGGKVRIGVASECLARALTRALGWSLSASRAIVRPGLLVALLIVLAPIFLVLTQSGLHAIPLVNSIVVTTTDDPVVTSGYGFCTLREAIDNANDPGVDTTGGDCVKGTGNDDITFSPSTTGTITLGTNGELPAILNTLTIDGTGQNITIDGSLDYQILYVSGALTVNDLTIENGASDTGAGIENAGTLTVTNSTFLNNSGQDGGGILSEGGTLTVTNSTFSGNNAFGGAGAGIWNHGPLNVTNSTFYDNDAAFGLGGGIYSQFGTVKVTNSTFSGNTASLGGGGGILSYGTATVTNSILATSTGGNCSGTIADGGYNISDDGSCSFTGTSVKNTNPLLATAGLANNGGPTETIALQATSPAVDVIPSGNANCPGFDQRGDPRPAHGFSNCDIGAYELQPTITVNTTADPGLTTQCDLRDAITAANTQAVVNGCAAGSGNDLITFSVSGTSHWAARSPQS